MVRSEASWEPSWASSSPSLGVEGSKSPSRAMPISTVSPDEDVGFEDDKVDLPADDDQIEEERFGDYGYVDMHSEKRAARYLRNRMDDLLLGLMSILILKVFCSQIFSREGV